MTTKTPLTGCSTNPTVAAKPGTGRGRPVAWLVFGLLLSLTGACVSEPPPAELGSDVILDDLEDSSETSLVEEPDDAEVLVVTEDHISEEVAKPPPVVEDGADSDLAYEEPPGEDIPPELVAIGDEEALACAKIQFAMDARSDGASDSDNPVLAALVAENAGGDSAILIAVGRVVADVTNGTDADQAMRSAMEACVAEGYEP